MEYDCLKWKFVFEKAACTSFFQSAGCFLYTAARNPSPVTGFATMWRGRGDNPHPINPADAKARGLSPNQMYMCPTCELNRRLYERIINNRRKR